MKIWNVLLVTFAVFAVMVCADIAAIKTAAANVADLAVTLKNTVEKEQGTTKGSATSITTAATNLDGAVQKAITAVQADQTVVDDATADKFIDALTSISDASKTISARFIAIKGNLTQLGVLDATKKLVKGATADVKTLGAGLVGKIPPTKRKSAQKLVDDINASWSKAAQSYS